MSAKLAPPKAKATPPKGSKAAAYKTIGRTSDGVFVLKPQMAMSPLGKKLARLMAEGQATTTATGRVVAHPTKSSRKRTS